MTAASETNQRLRAIARRAMLERHLQPDFAPAVLSELQGLQGPAPTELPDLRDLRELPWLSIDNDDSRDLDQLSVAEPLADGAVRVRVAIADVDALVVLGGAIDEHARINTTSIYTIAQTFPMLPLRLSTDLTSLGQGQARAALVIDMSVDTAGAIVSSELYRAVVVNHAKLAYGSVAAWLDGTAAAPLPILNSTPLQEQLRLQQQVAGRLRDVRHRHGALSLASTEPRALYEADRLTDLLPDTQNAAQELIEDLMIAANGVTASYLSSRGLPSLRRVLRTPLHWDRLMALAARAGDSLSSEPSAAGLNALLVRRRLADPGGFADLSLAVVKLLGRGEYVLEMPHAPVPGHFALAVQDYTHATAPNRRFPDLITQRLLKAALTAHSSPYAVDTLTALAMHCTAQEDNAAKVERRVRKSAAALLLADRLGQRFDAIVTGAADKGTWVRIAAPMTEGRLVRGHEGLGVGDRLRVRLVSTDVERGFIDFERVA